jgi:uncharacterized membrane protein
MAKDQALALLLLIALLWKGPNWSWPILVLVMIALNPAE